ncbi:hypothetical protein ANOM_001221 [Aspergillus nomiae NRRL 13137]|uniref:AMP-dependent synthetase/ligase domain-containing protein n=1 Tax=Aspergillus nomiae NRRL (strain ATCC 15546 / NRRL 13137 / CBS 260.88 / M93) TaxID=1509407 RepID=A0A0L1JFI0_ASPN3|nr:uncharacterized protein ANOM_001221 [Aspergillus nomiae NRRL 13137]KNG90486.1 hypothetical protein ANOM_001221 [Aspergillus nomiae NRRL 13137]
MDAECYSLSDVLAIASVHPFYSDVVYPPTREELPSLLTKARDSGNGELLSFPLTHKEQLYSQIARLTLDKDPRNGYRLGTYISTTGGGSGGPPMVFATDSIETRRQRAAFGSLMQTSGVLSPGDWICTMHTAGHLYRALDLMTEVFEASGATVLCAGNEMPLDKVVLTITEFGVNAVAGDAGQLVQLAQYVAGLPHTQKHTLQTQINKALYTSEPMTPAQRSFLKSVFSNVAISSVIGSAEAGPWGVSTGEMTESVSQHNYEDFLYDDRLMHLEILPSSILDPGRTEKTPTAPVPDGEKGLLVQTSLQRLRNPLVRYVCGDVASFHPLPASIQSRLTPEDASHLRVARVYGRDRNISFDWYGEYFEFPVVQRLFQTESWGILQYQVIRRYREPDPQKISVTQRGFPNDPIFNQLRRLAKQSPGVLFHDEYGVDARYSDLIRDVIHLREILRGHLPSASFDEQGCLREDAKSIAFLAYTTGLNADEALYFLKKTKAAYILTEKRTLEMATTFTDHARNEGQRATLITISRADPATATISSSTEFEINQELTFPETAGCLILFTSGTTGPPKGVVLPRKMFHYEEDITPATLYLASCPPHWIGGTGLIDSVLIGENLHMLKSEAPPARFWEVLREGRATEMAISPTMLRRLMEYYQENISHLAAEQRNEYINGAKKLERVIVSGSMLSPFTWRFFADLTGMPIINGYGSTEMGGGVIINPPGAAYKQGYIGKVIPGRTVKLSHGDHGEVLVKSPIRFSHYIGDEAATRAAFDEEGFYKTGDQAHRVGDDYYFDGRISSDFVRFHEYTISIPELESQLLDLSYITDAYVLPVKDHGAGGLVAALVRLQKQEGESTTLKQIRDDLAATNLPSYKLPTLLRVLQNEEQVPLTSSDKVLKKECLRKFFHISEYIPDPYAVEGVEYWGNQLDLATSSRVFDWGGL